MIDQEVDILESNETFDLERRERSLALEVVMIII